MIEPDVGVLVVDDSRTTRAFLAGVLGADPRIVVVGEAADGIEALALTKQLRPSVVVMDIEMPEMDGFEATKRIMIEEPTPIIIVTARYDVHQVEIGLRAVRAGALTILPKPAGPGSKGPADQVDRLVMLVKALADVKVVRRRADRRDPPGDARPPGVSRARTVEAVAVAASTGGPAALFRFLEVLPRTLDIPVLVVQHIAEGFVNGLAAWLGSATVLPVCVAEDNQALKGGQVYIAPDGYHLEVKGRCTRLSEAPPVGGFRPSASVLIGSLADSYGSGAAAVVLTGMGTDGLDGAARLRAAGGIMLAQDAASSVVFGMPQAVAKAGLADVVGPVEELAYRIVRFAPNRR